MQYILSEQEYQEYKTAMEQFDNLKRENSILTKRINDTKNKAVKTIVDYKNTDILENKFKELKQSIIIEFNNSSLTHRMEIAFRGCDITTDDMGPVLIPRK